MSPIQETTIRAGSGSPRLKALHVAAVAAGNGLEFFDFMIFATFAIYIGRAYFPSRDPTVSLLVSLATFGIGFVTRPIGGFVIGRLGDRAGRQPALMLSFGLMGAGTLGLALTPTYAAIGVAAPAIVIFARLVQGFALGGEVGPATAYLIEAAGERRRGQVGAWQSATQGLAMLMSAAVAVALSFALPRAALEAWGWRLAFLAGLAIVPFALVVRRSLPETAPARRVATRAQAGKAPWALVGLSVVLLAYGTISTYVSNYLTTFAIDTLKMAPRAAFGVGLVTGGLVLVLTPVGGWLSDRVGRKRVMIPCTIVSGLVILPAFSWLIAHPSPAALYATTVLMTAPGALGSAAMIVGIAESFPARTRSFAVGAIYATAIAVFGGSAQFVVALLIHALHAPIAPAWYRLGATLFGLAAMIALPESAPARRDARLAIGAAALSTPPGE